MDKDPRRAKRLNDLFFTILSGKEKISQNNAPLFLEAIYSRPEPAACLNKIIASQFGLEAIQQALWSKSDAQFINDRASPLIAYFQAPELKVINGGQYLNDIILKVAEPPMFWDACRQLFLARQIQEGAQLSVGWLLLQLCCLPTDLATPYRQHPDTQAILQMLLSSPFLPLRTVGQKVKHVLDTCMSLNAVNNTLGQGPGGRHDNDFEDFRQISILPTADEIASLEPSFLRPSSVLEDPETEPTRVTIHLDNQFRLLREDMLYEMREELQILLGKKKGFHRGVKVSDLYIKEVDCGPERKRTRCALVIICNSDIPILARHGDLKRRKEFLIDHPRILKHQSLACLVSGTEIIAFPTIFRDVDRLAKVPPEIVLHFENEESIRKALQKLKLDDGVMLLQIDTAIFSYEPILKRLQENNTLPLASELLLWKKGISVAQLDDSEQASPIVEALGADIRTNLQSLLSSSKPIDLDASQAKSLISGLTQRVSLLQGPPGLFPGCLAMKLS